MSENILDKSNIFNHHNDSGAKSKLKISDEYCKMLIGNIRDFAIFLLDIDGIIASWNPGANHITGYMEEEILGTNISCLYTPEDILLKKSETILNKALKNSHAEEEDWRIKKDGSLFWANEAVAPLYDHQGQHTGFSIVIRDFSKRKQAQDALAKTLKELADIKFALDESTIIATTDKDGIITYVNDKFCQISKYSREELIGSTHKIIKSDYHSKEFFTAMWQDLSMGKVWKGEFCNLTKDKNVFWLDTTIVPFVNQDGEPYQYISIRHDITARKYVEMEIRQLNEEMEERIHLRTAELEEANLKLSETLSQLQESEKMRSTFISALTHDLRTPLVAQERALELFLSNRQKLPQKLSALAERLAQSNEGLLKMVNMLLETYQYESGKIHLLWESVCFKKIVEECFSEVSSLAEAKQINLVDLIPSEFPYIQGDSHQIRRVMMNLIGNALENIPSESNIIIRGIDSPDYVTVEVEDNGPGISEDTLPHLFQRYYVGDHTRKKIGTGLGLYICRMIMEQHHGYIKVKSQLGKGTCFFLTFLKKPF